MNILTKIIWISGFLLLLIFPMFSFKIGIEIEILPSLELIFVYYLYCYCNIRLWQIFLLGIIFDQFYSMPIGTNSLALLLAALGVRLAAKWFLIKDYLTNFTVFCGFCLIVTYLRYLILASKGWLSEDWLLIALQYLTTIFSYPLVRILLDKSSPYLKSYVKQ